MNSEIVWGVFWGMVWFTLARAIFIAVMVMLFGQVEED